MHERSLEEEERCPVVTTYPTVFLVDDDALTIRSLTDLFLDRDLRVLSCSGVGDMLERLECHEPGIVVLNSQLPDGAGLEVQQHLRSLDQDMPIIFVSHEQDVRTCVQAMKAGAIDFLLKPLDRYALLKAMDTALAKAGSSRALTEVRRKTLKCAAALTRREREVFELVTTGLMNKQIAFELGISEIMVKIHRGKVMRKMEAQSLADLVRTSELLASVESPRSQVLQEVSPA